MRGNKERNGKTLEEGEKSRYFQAIARAFFSWRGAPFFLSSKDLDLISRWEDMEIPLSIVLEGIEKAFSSLKKRAAERHKVRSLYFCHIQVMKAFEQCRERKIGGQKKGETREDKRQKILAEVRGFLGHIPPDVSYLRNGYLEAEKKLSRPRVDEDWLEEMDEKIEELLRSHCPEEIRVWAVSEILKESRGLREEDRECVLGIKLVKLLRERYRIPYLSFFYH